MKAIFEHTIEGRIFIVRVSRHRRAKRLSMRFDDTEKIVKLTVPLWATEKQAKDFLLEAEGWIQKQAGKTISASPFEHGMLLPILGVDHRFEHNANYGCLDVTREETAEGALITVHGPLRRFNEMAHIFLQRHAKAELAVFCEEYAVQIRATVNKTTVRDTKSRWGSCSSQGNISLSWRLILAPLSVARYVCAHEVCHLLEMNHSARFWDLVWTIDPTHKDSKQWLREHGKTLHSYGYRRS